jgi:Flp pilus assembly protein TadD
MVIMVTGCQTGRKNLSGKNILAADDWASNQAMMKAAEKSGNLEVALAAGARELLVRPNNREARIFLAKIQTRAGLLEQALFTLEPLQQDNTTEVKLEQARVLLAQGQTESALSIIDEALTRKLELDSSRTARKLKAIGEDQSGRHPAAQAIYSQLLIELDEPTVRHNYAQSLLATKNYQQAVTVLKPLLDLPQFSRSRLVAAAALVKANDRQGARDLMEGHLPEAEINRLLRGKK